MGSRITLAAALGCVTIVAQSGAAPPAEQRSVCRDAQLAFALPAVSAPHQHGAVGLSVHNTGRTCQLRLPVTLTLSGRHSRIVVSPRVSRLTLTGTLRARGRAFVTWAYRNYCGGDKPGQLPVRYRVGVHGIELSSASTGAECYDRRLPVAVSVLFACPGATGPAISEVTSRRFPLCPRG
jgi:hypothetical protein